MAGDSERAEEALRTSGPYINGTQGIIGEPVELHRAFFLWQRGQRDQARELVEVALAYFDREKWNPRQQPLVLIAKARAHALAGRAEPASRLADEAYRTLKGRDAYVLSSALRYLAVIYGQVGERDRAFEHLRELCAGPGSFSTWELRRDPTFAGLREDPRFEEILKEMKTL
jgi:tetratricopeptide (TPR) repeat protein